jgi:hypothetical protein
MQQPAPFGQPQPHPQPPAPKKGLSGCLIAILVFVGLVFVGLIFVGYGAYKVYSSPEGQKLAKVVGEGAKLAEEARKAPGTTELRKAGCQEAMVMDPARMAELMAEFDDGGAKEMGKLENQKLVICQVGALVSTKPACDTLARTYVDATHPTEPFHVTVQVQGGHQPVCEKVYEPDGKPRSGR